MSKMTVTYLENLRCEATHQRSGKKLITDAPKDNHGQGEAFSPTDLLCTSLATCMITLVGITANKRNIPLKGAEAEIEKIMDSNPRKVSQIKIQLTIKGVFSKSQKEEMEYAALNCPVAKSIHPEIHQDVKIIYK